MLTSSNDANLFCNQNNHCEKSFPYHSPPSPRVLHSPEQSSQTVRIDIYFLFLLSSSVLSQKASEWQNISLYTEALLLKLWPFSLFFLLQWCTIYVMYLCVATSENAIKPRWIPFSLSINEIELCTLMYLFTFVFYFSLLVFHRELDAR